MEGRVLPETEWKTSGKPSRTLWGNMSTSLRMTISELASTQLRPPTKPLLLSIASWQLCCKSSHQREISISKGALRKVELTLQRKSQSLLSLESSVMMNTTMRMCWYATIKRVSVNRSSERHSLPLSTEIPHIWTSFSRAALRKSPVMNHPIKSSRVKVFFCIAWQITPHYQGIPLTFKSSLQIIPILKRWSLLRHIKETTMSFFRSLSREK